MENFIRRIALDAARHFECTELYVPKETWSCGIGFRSAAMISMREINHLSQPLLRGRMYCYLKTNLGVIALSKDEMERVRLPQKLCHAEGKTIDEIATLLYISGMSAAYHIHFLSVFDL